MQQRLLFFSLIVVLSWPAAAGTFVTRVGACSALLNAHQFLQQETLFKQARSQGISSLYSLKKNLRDFAGDTKPSGAVVGLQTSALSKADAAQLADHINGILQREQASPDRQGGALLDIFAGARPDVVIMGVNDPKIVNTLIDQTNQDLANFQKKNVGQLITLRDNAKRIAVIAGAATVALPTPVLRWAAGVIGVTAGVGGFLSANRIEVMSEGNHIAGAVAPASDASWTYAHSELRISQAFYEKMRAGKVTADDVLNEENFNPYDAAPTPTGEPVILLAKPGTLALDVNVFYRRLPTPEFVLAIEHENLPKPAPPGRKPKRAPESQTSPEIMPIPGYGAPLPGF